MQGEWDEVGEERAYGWTLDRALLAEAMKAELELLLAAVVDEEDYV